MQTNTEPTTTILASDDLDAAVSHYLVTALWSSVEWAEGDDEPFQLDYRYDVSDIADETLTQTRTDVAAFVELAGYADITAYLEHFDHDAQQLGHDLWLTRNHHGAGFWDRGLGELGDRLTAHAHSLGDADLYVGDDGLVHMSWPRPRRRPRSDAPG